MADTDEIIISAPKLTKFTALGDLFCFKCGTKAIPDYVNYISAMIGRGTLSAFSIRYCTGGLEPTEDGTAISIAIGHAPVIGQFQQRNSCSGVNGEHLHVICKTCSDEYLMKVREG